MKILVVFLVIFVLFQFTTARRGGNLHHSKISMKKVQKQCQKNEETRIDPDVLKKLRKGEEVVQLPDNFPDHVTCLMKGMEYLNDDNTVNEQKVRNLVQKRMTEDQDVDAIVGECKAVKTALKETALNLINCLRKHELLWNGNFHD